MIAYQCFSTNLSLKNKHKLGELFLPNCLRCNIIRFLISKKKENAIITFLYDYIKNVNESVVDSFMTMLPWTLLILLRYHLDSNNLLILILYRGKRQQREDGMSTNITNITNFKIICCTLNAYKRAYALI